MLLSVDKDLHVNPEAMKKWIDEQCACGLTAANQALNDVVGDRHKATPWSCVVAGVNRTIKHNSAGKNGTWKTCTVFFVEYPDDTCFVVGLGKHKSSKSYTLKYVKSQWVGRRVGDVVDLESD